MPEIRWLYPTSTATKAHAFLGAEIRPPSNEEKSDIERGLQSLCRKYARYSVDRGSTTRPLDERTCKPCARKAEERR